ncbi:MAG TPA: MarR family transcriptional regulator [Jatrophihabitans sp.]|nr:MarR family transcriptional regulator [Jatrophihabitans sp.]
MTDLADKPVAPVREDVAEVADNLISLWRSFSKARSRMLAAAEHDVEWSAHMVLKCIQNCGQPRATELAEHLQSDPSTVSRQVAALVKDGFIERRADPDDGRASLLALTPKADAVLAENDQIRLDFFNRVLDGWSDAELRRFASMLHRFNAAYEAANSTLITDRLATRAGRAGSRN